MPTDNSHHLIAAARRRRMDTLARARRTLHELGETGKRFTVTDIAARAGVSRAWLYNQDEFRDDIRRLTTSPAVPAATVGIERGSDTSLRQRLALAHARIRELDTENRELRNQVARLHGQLRTHRLEASSVIDTVHDTNSLFNHSNDRTDLR